MTRPAKIAALSAIALLLATALAPAASAAPKCGGERAKIIGTKKADTLNGTPGDDVIVGGGGADVIDGMGGDDIICGGPGQDKIKGGTGNDAIAGQDDNDKFLSGGPGDDRIAGGDGKRDGIDYRESAAGVTVDLAARTVTGEGSDEVKEVEMVRGSKFADSITGSDANNIVSGEEGKDEIFGGAGEHDVLRGGPGNDTLDGGDGRYDLANFGNAEKGINANLASGKATGAGTDELNGFEGLAGSAFDDTLIGDEGANAFLGYGGDDTFRGGEDTELDLALFWYAPGPVTADLGDGTATGEGTDELVDIDGIYGSEFDDELIGSSGGNALLGFGGNDTLRGQEGDDFFAGDEGGDDVIDGGPGSYDLVSYRKAEASINADLGAGGAAGDGNDVLGGIEALVGSPLHDTLAGDVAQNYLFGKQGSDTLSGGAGDDYIEGGSEEDSGDGGEGTDNCIEIEQLTSCEGAEAAPEHPLKSGVEATQDVGKEFAKRNNM